MFTCSTIKKSCDLKTTATKTYIIYVNVLFTHVFQDCSLCWLKISVSSLNLVGQGVEM